MGYRYFHRMEVKNLLIDDAKQMCDLIDKYSEEKWNYYQNQEGIVFHLDENSWAETEYMLAMVSCHYPGKVFCVETIGEEWDDRYLVYGKDGKVQVCPMIITFEEPYEFFVETTETVV